ncbi:MAG TPA: hypothetical protein V6C96_05365 [Vampirovibrionales bacterium]
MDKNLPKLNCEINTHLIFIEECISENEKVYIGDVYLVLNLVGFGWDLKKVRGHGPEFLRIMNSDINKYTKRVCY